MRDTTVPDNIVPICPDCAGDMTFVSSWQTRDTWGYDEVRTYECPLHGSIFIKAEISVVSEAAASRSEVSDEGDRDALLPVRGRPTPVINAGAIAVPEPDPE